MAHYVWDDKKAAANKEKHNVSFDDAWRVYENPDKATIKSDHLEEERFIDYAKVDEVILCLVYTLRNDDVRIISFRRAKHPKETQVYERRGESGYVYQ